MSLAEHDIAFLDADAQQADKDEVDFLEDLYALLKAAHFRVLTVEEWEAAVRYDFTVSHCVHPLLSLYNSFPGSSLAISCTLDPQLPRLGP